MSLFVPFLSSPPEILLISVKIKRGSLEKRRQWSLGNNSEPGRKGKRMGPLLWISKGTIWGGAVTKDKESTWLLGGHQRENLLMSLTTSPEP